VDLAVVVINIIPLQRQQFALPQSNRGSQVNHGSDGGGESRLHQLDGLFLAERDIDLAFLLFR